MSATTEFLVELHDVTAAEGAAGKEVRVPVRGIPTHLNGWPVHIMQLIFRPTLQVDTNVAMPTAFDGHHQLTLIQNLSVKWGRDHYFLQGKTALDCHKDNRIRRSQTPSDPSDIADATASDVTNAIDFTVDFCHPDAPVESRYDGSVPVILMTEDNNIGTALSFSIGTAALPGIASVTVDQITGKIYARCVALPKLRAPTPQRVEVFEDTKKTMALRPRGPIEYMSIVDRNDSSDAFTQSQADYGNVNFLRDNELLIGGKAVTFAAIQHNEYRSYRSPPTISETAPEHGPLIAMDETHRRTRMSRALESYRLEILDTRGGRAQTRIGWREIGLWTDQYAAMIKESMRVPAGVRDAAIPVTGSGNPEHLQIMDHYVYWDAMDVTHGFKEPARRLEAVFNNTVPVN